jgi:hypothetical protein
VKYILALILIAIAALWIPHRMEQEYAKGVEFGRKTALNVTNPSEALEIACVSLWVNEQNKKYQRKENAR